MTVRIVITGKLGKTVEADALAWLARCIADVRPDEVVCFEASIPMLDQLREVYAGPIGIHAGEFDPRHGVIELQDVHSIGPGWVTMCRIDGCEPSEIAGNTALRAAKALQTSVVLGHTGRLGIGSCTTGYGGEAAWTVTGMEVGRCEQAVGLLTIDGLNVEPEIVQLRSRSTRN
ncbi:hypothetical protein [Mycobacterium sp. GA-1841]|uniref:hypothetical protein n=1 Tax=Mycobacterium sp. GA-1841 TaxID=1834154 RepID=UPI0011155E2C|nr:hypothetical protein [Mycobacterium sp. GA-1841]